MVKTIEHKNMVYFKCESCGFYYLEEDLAKKCEDFCNKYKSCNIEITKNAVDLS